jgi:thiosulfate dehydrogenase
MKFLIGLIVGLLILPILLLLYAASGHMPVATSDPPIPGEAALAGSALYGRIRREAPNRDVSNFATSELVSGANIYQSDCAMCHGLPNQPVPPVALGEFPRPPQLFTSDGSVTDDPAGVTFWKVKNGIRLSGMPGFGKSLTDMQMWQVAALLARADKLPPQVMDALKPGAPVIQITAGAAPPASNSTGTTLPPPPTPAP